LLPGTEPYRFEQNLPVPLHEAAAAVAAATARLSEVVRLDLGQSSVSSGGAPGAPAPAPAPAPVAPPASIATVPAAAFAAAPAAAPAANAANATRAAARAAGDALDALGLDASAHAHSSAPSAGERAALGEVLRDLPAEVLDAARISADSLSRVDSLLEPNPDPTLP
jgi:hypothetical protein